uniref:Putative secreted peptide n=1 Tax=Anopheles braziliensis TaxID=58242 RepID=A0A2M3ZXM3_9DIPT
MPRATNATTTIATVVMVTDCAATIPHTQINSRHAATPAIGATIVIARLAISAIETIASFATSLSEDGTATAHGTARTGKQRFFVVLCHGR